MGFAMAATLYEPAFASVVSWFATRGRDRALLTLTLAARLASTIFMPLEAWLLVKLGWVTLGSYERLFWLLAAALAVVSPITSQRFRKSTTAAWRRPIGVMSMTSPSISSTLSSSLSVPASTIAW
jgi:hypothetical protein